jgi:hypothetical protein
LAETTSVNCKPGKWILKYQPSTFLYEIINQNKTISSLYQRKPGKIKQIINIGGHSGLTLIFFKLGNSIIKP